MHSRTHEFTTVASVCGVALMLVVAAGCCNPAAHNHNTALIRPAGEPGVGQQQFDSDDQAAAALVAAAKARDHEALHHIFGPSVTEFVSGDKVADETAFNHFTKKVDDHLELEKINTNSSMIDIGKDKWPFPIPLTRLANGKWFFDTEAGKTEILNRRIGRNELETIKVCRAYLEAQREYASVDRDGSGVLKYAQHFISKHGNDGLYWKTAPGEEESPFGEFVAQATLEGYTPGQNHDHGPQPYHGYLYRMLTRQGPDAPGGRYDYVINGNMIAGFALVACPVAYGNSGVMTFMINHQGKVYQKDLGAETLDIVRDTKEYDVDSSWTLVTD